MESEPMLKNPLYRSLRGGSNPRRCVMQDSEPGTLPIELFRRPPPSRPECERRGFDPRPVIPVP